jgi:hypothetical protein|tara:strand:+ start:6441 stop:6707 length:267 start_codon:yes stop_codon:yes gene_type:complete
MPVISNNISKTTAVFSFDLKNFTMGLLMSYISNTELRFEKIVSFIRSQKAMNKYNANAKPTVTKVTYMKEVRTTLALMPNRSAMRWQT